MVRLLEIKLHNRETTIEVMRGARTPQRLYVPPTPPHTERGGLLKGTNKAVTTCQLPLQTVGIVDIQQLLANLDTMSTLVSDTLVSRVEPPPFGWTDIILEQTYEYWNSSQSSKANMLIISCTGQ